MNLPQLVASFLSNGCSVVFPSEIDKAWGISEHLNQGKRLPLVHEPKAAAGCQVWPSIGILGGPLPISASASGVSV